MRLPVVPLLALVLVLQGVGVAALFDLRPMHWDAPAPQAPNPDSYKPVELAVARASRRAYTEQVERPLFVAGRRPVVETAAVAAPPEPEIDLDFLEEVQLLGVYGAGGDEGGIILRQEGEVKRIAVGARLESLTLARVDGMNAVFWDGRNEHVLRLTPRPRANAPQQPRVARAEVPTPLADAVDQPPEAPPVPEQSELPAEPAAAAVAPVPASPPPVPRPRLPRPPLPRPPLPPLP